MNLNNIKDPNDHDYVSKGTEDLYWCDEHETYEDPEDPDWGNDDDESEDN